MVAVAVLLQAGMAVLVAAVAMAALVELAILRRYPRLKGQMAAADQAVRQTTAAVVEAVRLQPGLMEPPRLAVMVVMELPHQFPVAA